MLKDFQAARGKVLCQLCICSVRLDEEGSDAAALLSPETGPEPSCSDWEHPAALAPRRCGRLHAHMGAGTQRGREEEQSLGACCSWLHSVRCNAVLAGGGIPAWQVMSQEIRKEETFGAKLISQPSPAGWFFAPGLPQGNHRAGSSNTRRSGVIIWAPGTLVGRNPCSYWEQSPLCPPGGWQGCHAFADQLHNPP